MRAERVVRRNSFRHQIGPLWRNAVVDMLAEIAVGPAIETAVLYRGHVIRHQIIAELVALVDGDPQRAALRLPTRPVRIAKAGGEHAPLAGRTIDFEHRGAIGLGLDAVFAD